MYNRNTIFLLEVEITSLNFFYRRRNLRCCFDERRNCDCDWKFPKTRISGCGEAKSYHSCTIHVVGYEMKRLNYKTKIFSIRKKLIISLLQLYVPFNAIASFTKIYIYRIYIENIMRINLLEYAK